MSHPPRCRCSASLNAAGECPFKCPPHTPRPRTPAPKREPNPPVLTTDEKRRLEAAYRAHVPADVRRRNSARWAGKGAGR